MKRITLAAALAVALTAPVALAQVASSPPGPTVQSLLMSAAVAVTPVLTTALAGLIAAALVALTRKLQAQAGESKLAELLSRVSVLAEAVVRDVEVTLRPELVAAAADGVLTQAEWQRLKTAAVQRLLAGLGAGGQAELAERLRLAPTSVPILVSGLVEAAVSKLKGEGGGAAINLGPVELGADAVRALVGKEERGAGSSNATPSRAGSLAVLLLALPLVGLLGQGCTPLHASRLDAGAERTALQVPAVDYRPAASDAQCASWDSSRLTWGVVGTVSGALGAAGGGVALLTNLVGEDRGAQLALGLTSVLLGALTVGASYAEDGLTARYAERCTVPATAPEAR